MSMSKSKVNPEEQLLIGNSQINQLERENARVVEQLKEVIKMNTHWQRYDSQREEYALKLTRTNQELQDEVSDLQCQVRELSIAGGNETEMENPKVEAAHLAAKNKGDDEEELEVSRKEGRIVVLTDRIAELKEKLCEMEKGRQSRKKADEDEMSLLREQVNVCVEDFKQERKDRERIHGENERLRERLADAENRMMENAEQIYVYQEQIKELQHRRPVVKPPQTNGYDEPCCYPETRPHRVRAPVYAQNTYRHPLYFGDDLSDLPRNVEVDGFQDKNAADQPDESKITIADATDGDNPQKDEDDKFGDEQLECPRCLASFGQDEYNDFQNHIDKCV